MNKALFLCLSLAAIFAINSPAAEGNTRAGGGARYNSGARTWTEGRVTNRGADGRLTVHGTTSPYANNYFSYHHDYFANPDLRVDLGNRYRDRFGYTWNDDGLTDYTYTVPDYDSTVIYDEPNYGNDYTTWTYDGEPRTYRYNDLNIGDRVVIGLDENGNKVHSIHRVNPGTAAGRNPATHTDNTRPNNAGAKDNTRPTK